MRFPRSASAACLALGIAAMAVSPIAGADPWRRHHHHHGRPGIVVQSWTPWYAPPPWARAPVIYAPPVVVSRPAPVYIEQPPVAVAPARTGWWYFCDSAGAYHPYVRDCPGGWRQVAPQLPALPQ